MKVERRLKTLNNGVAVKIDFGWFLGLFNSLFSPGKEGLERENGECRGV